MPDNSSYYHDWADIAFGSKKPLSNLKAHFVMAPRELSGKRFKQLIKDLLPSGPLLIGIAKEPYIDGFEGQEQFKTLELAAIKPIVDMVNASASKHKIHVISYFQREFTYIVQKIPFCRVTIINGSWQYTFHTTPYYYALIKAGVPYLHASPFVDEDEASEYAQSFQKKMHVPSLSIVKKETDILNLAASIAKNSFDYSFQTGVVLARPVKTGYEVLAYAYNAVIPYQTYAMHHGASREIHLSPTQDQNHYDTIHAEISVLMGALQSSIDLSDSTLYINLLPCPACSRVLSQTDIAEVVYQQDHSDGYAVRLFELSHIKVRRLVY